ncbi:hypothetical protein RD792_017862 [Penstemon davidsonii]|uniref:Vesicle-associated membrane protein 727 n=1 Tax=Penstemon davidsonii TaxID=160366 RepID=A0ABR0DVK3_9LAMI|nr:hypothetical protein RD792_017862 [Penstemon davidsonii]
MSPKGLIYSFVAKGSVVLAEHTPYSGNFSTIAVQCLQKLPSSSNKYTYSCDGHTFNFLLDSGFIFLVVADESMGRSVPFVFLERVKDDFKQRYGDSIKSDDPHPLADDDDEDDDLFEDRFSFAYNLDREFGPTLKEHMQYFMNHPEEINKLSKLKSQITEVKGIMMDNIEKVLDRGEKIELLVDKTENLQFQFPKARKTATSKDVVSKSSNEADDRRSALAIPASHPLMCIDYPSHARGPQRPPVHRSIHIRESLITKSNDVPSRLDSTTLEYVLDHGLGDQSTGCPIAL